MCRNPRFSGVNCRQSNVRKFEASYLVQIPGKIRLKYEILDKWKNALKIQLKCVEIRDNPGKIAAKFKRHDVR
jgi:hypothetical protein